LSFPRISLPSTLPRTEKLFHRDPDLLNCSARIIYVSDEFVVLDRSIFYAESGGQDFDTGFIDDIPVIDVQDQGGELLSYAQSRVPLPSIRIDTIIVHKLMQPSTFQKGQEVQLSVNKDRRKKLSESHSAAHFLFHASKELFENDDNPLPIKGCHIGEKEFRFDFSGDLSRDQAIEAGELANSLMLKGGGITMEASEASDEIFYWLWEDVIIPCGGTHVKSADQVPSFSVRRSKKGKSTTRIRGVLNR